MPDLKVIDEEESKKAARALVGLLEEKRRFTHQLNRYQNPQVREEIKEELQIIEFKLNNNYQDLKEYYRRRTNFGRK